MYTAIVHIVLGAGLLLGIVNAVTATETAQKENAWSRITHPRGTFSEAIGRHSNGCQLGAHVLPAHGQGYISIRRSRNRFYTQPVTIGLVKQVGRVMAGRYHRQILVGDLSLPVGGKMPYGHSSHQNGLDVDIWFYTVPKQVQPSSNLEPPTVVDKVDGRMLLSRWQPAYTDALFAAAAYPETTRIFVNPIIKHYLCQLQGNDAKRHALLRKIRPWWGHDAHFHVRLRCPTDSPDCVDQPPPPPGDGCDAGLLNWIAQQRDAIIHPKPPQPQKSKSISTLPARCAALLQQ